MAPDCTLLPNRYSPISSRVQPLAVLFSRWYLRIGRGETVASAFTVKRKGFRSGTSIIVLSLCIQCQLVIKDDQIPSQNVVAHSVENIRVVVRKLTLSKMRYLWVRCSSLGAGAVSEINLPISIMYFQGGSHMWSK